MSGYRTSTDSAPIWAAASTTGYSSEPAGAKLYQVGDLNVRAHQRRPGQWITDPPQNAVIEITDSGVYAEQLNISI